VPAAYPLMLDVTDRLAVILGGGAVAVRKARGLIDAGATRIRMISPAFHADVPAGVQKVTARYEPGHLEGAGLVFAATDSAATNDQIVREARRRGIWVNRADADAHEPGDFTTPAVLRQGPVTVAVATMGAPALAVKVRDELHPGGGDDAAAPPRGVWGPGDGRGHGETRPRGR
jgi:siroheme synthase-like protein